MSEDQTSPEALIDAGNARSALGDHVTAEHLFAEAARLGSLDARYNQGNELMNLRRWSEAAEAHRLAADAGDREAPLNLGISLEVLGDVEGAAAAYRRAADADDPQGTVRLGRLLWRNDRREEGDAVLREAATSGDCPAAMELAGLLEHDGPADEVEALYLLACGVDEDAITDLGRYLRGIGRFEEAEAVLWPEVASGSTDAMIALANLLEDDLGRTNEAEQLLRKAIELGELFAYNNLGLLLEWQGSYVEAHEMLLRGGSWRRRQGQAEREEVLGPEQATAEPRVATTEAPRSHRLMLCVPTSPRHV